MPFAPEYQDPRTRMPITHPDYRYPVSRNPYHAKLKPLEGRVFVDNAAEEHRGHWRERFLDGKTGPRPLHVEIGCNGGHVILEWAARDPAGAYIGLDWKFKQIHRGAEKARARKIDNLIFFRAHADRIRYMFDPGEIDELSLFFPDPWPKKAQWKNRSVNPENLRAWAGIVRPGGRLHIKTDHDGYAEWMRAAFAETPECWKVVAESSDLHASHPAPETLAIPEVTLFERIFIAQGIRIKSFRLERTQG